MKRRRAFLLLELFILAGLLIVYFVFFVPNTFEGNRFITVSKGENFTQVVDSLAQAGIIRSRATFEIAGRALNLTTRMQIGKYRFRSGVSNKEILEDLRHGKNIELITVTIREGLKAAKQAKIFTKQLRIDSTRFMELVNDSAFVHSLGIADTSLEGYLMPNTYLFYWQDDEETILKEMVKDFWTVFNDTLRKRMDEQALSLNDVMTLSSIVEAETAIDSERAIVAGVYYNRLRKNMRLEADPTIQYIIEDGPRRLVRSDLFKESPYNTYRHYGLPPGPINNPGRTAILAALYPMRHKYLYFVATGQGGHTFSRTYDQHQRAVRQFRRVRELQQAIKQEG